MYIHFSDYESKIILKIVLSVKGVTWPRYERNMFKSLLMSYVIIKRNRIKNIVLLVQKLI